MLALLAMGEEEIEGYAPALLCRAHFHEQRDSLRGAASDYEHAAALLPTGPEREHALREANRVRARFM